MLDYLNLDSYESSRVSEIQEGTAGDPVFCETVVYNSERLMSSSLNEFALFYSNGVLYCRNGGSN